MKKTFKTMLALMAGAMVFTACDKNDIIKINNEQNPSALRPMVFTTSMEGQDGVTRATIDGLDIKWDVDDKISIFDGSTENHGNQEFALANGAGTTSGTFEGSAAEADTYYALYPYSASSVEYIIPTKKDAMAAAGKYANELNFWEMEYPYNPDSVESNLSAFPILKDDQAIILAYLRGDGIEKWSGPHQNGELIEGVVLPAKQTATAGSADPNAILMIAKSNDASSMEFKNICSYIKVTPEFDCSAISIEGYFLRDYLAGTVTVDYNSGDPAASVTYNGINRVTLTGTIVANTSYYIAVCPARLGYGFTLRFKASDGVFKKRTSKTITLTRNHVTNLGSFAKADLTLETTGTALATIDGETAIVNWIQLWAGGPKFAEHNVDQEMTFTEAAKTGVDYVWGANWCTPKNVDIEELLKAATSTGSTKVKCEYVQEGTTYGFKFTGKETGYTENSLFFPAQYGKSNYGSAYYWSGTGSDSDAWFLCLNYDGGVWCSTGSLYPSYLPGFVRPVLVE